MKKYFLFLFSAFICFNLFGQLNDSLNLGAAVDTAKEEYLTIVMKDVFINKQRAYVSMNGEHYDKYDFDSEGFYNLNGLLRLMREFNEDGWVLKTSNLAFGKESSNYLFVLMIRKSK